jgi:ribosomal protein S6
MENETEHYELTYIVAVKHLDDELNAVIAKIAGMLKDLGAEITADTIIGRQRLAYPIGQNFQGTYVSVEFNSEPDKLKKLDNGLKLMGELIRYLVIKKKIKTPEELEREAKIEERLRKEREEELKTLESREPHAPAMRTETAPVAEKTVEAPAEAEKTAEPIVEEPVAAKAEEKPAEVKAEEPAKAEPVKESSKKEKVSLEDLDKKLEEILTDDMI